MKISIFGTGYVGLVTGACLADVGHDVICADVNQAKIDGLKQGIIPIYEPGLENVVKTNVSQGNLRLPPVLKKQCNMPRLFISL